MNLLSKHLLTMEFRFDAILYSNMGNENYDAGRIKCSRGPQVAHTGPGEGSVFMFVVKLHMIPNLLNVQ